VEPEIRRPHRSEPMMPITGAQGPVVIPSRPARPSVTRRDSDVNA